jgi:hypothetical protein
MSQPTAGGCTRLVSYRVALTTPAFDRLASFYRAGLGMEPSQVWPADQGRALVLDMGKATLVHAPVVAPWGDKIVRFQDAHGIQITLYQAKSQD